MSFASGYLQGLELRDQQARDRLAERHAQAQEAFLQSEFDFRRQQWSDQQHADHAALYGSIYDTWNSLQNSFQPSLTKSATGDITVSGVVAPEERDHRTKAFRAMAIMKGLSPVEVDAITTGAPITPSLPTGAAPAGSAPAANPDVAAPAPAPAKPLWTRPGQAVADAASAPATAPAAATTDTTPPAPALDPTSVGLPVNAQQVAPGIFTIAHPDPLKRQSVTDLIKSFAQPQRLAAAAIARAAGDGAEKELTQALQKEMSQEEMLARMETLTRERQAGKESAGGEVDPATAQAWISGVKSGAYKMADIPKAYKDLVARGLGTDFKPAKKLTPTEQKDLDASKGLLSQIDTDMVPALDRIKNDNTSFYFAPQRTEYALGRKTQWSELFSFVERFKAVSARLLQGGRISQQMYDRLNVHLPNFYKDSPALVVQKLADVKQTLTEQMNAMEPGEPAQGSSLPKGDGKALTDPTIAKHFLDAAGGDKDQARKMAKEAGWQIQQVQ